MYVLTIDKTNVLAPHDRQRVIDAIRRVQILVAAVMQKLQHARDEVLREEISEAVDDIKQYVKNIIDNIDELVHVDFVVDELYNAALELQHMLELLELDEDEDTL